jgi:DNA-binding MarR family transcriptional regulator
MSQRKASRKSSPLSASDGTVGPAPAEDGPTEAEHLHALDAPGRRRLPPLLRLAWYSLNQAFRRRTHHLGLTPDQFTILRWLTECDPDWPTQRELGAMMASDPNTITSLLRRMEKAAIVERQPHETDRRANRIRITPAGKKVYIKARQIAVELQADVLRPLPEAKRDEFFELLDTVAQSCRQALGGSPAGIEIEEEEEER